MWFSQQALDEMVERVQQLGLKTCPVCQAAEPLTVWKQPAVIHVGGLETDEADPDANVRLAVLIFCRLCGHMMLFDSEQFYTGDEPILDQGPDGPSY